MLKYKNKSMFLKISLLILAVILTRAMVNWVNYYADANELNKSLSAEGLQLMMTIEQVRELLGDEEVFTVGFGGNLYEYPSKGVQFSVSTDSDYDLYYKVGEIRISNPAYSVFGIRVGAKEGSISEILRSRGYKENVDDYGQKTYNKGCVYLDFSVHENIVQGFRINVKDKKFDPNRVY